MVEGGGSLNLAMVLFDQLPDEIVLQALLELNLPSLHNLALTNWRLHHLLQDEHFWRQKSQRDYRSNLAWQTDSWRQFYPKYQMAWGWGSNSYHQLGLQDVRKVQRTPTPIRGQVKMVACGGFHTCLIDQEDAVWAWGCNRYGQLGQGDVKDRIEPTRLLFRAKTVACGEQHTMFIDLWNQVWVCGFNFQGQLGLGDFEHRLKPTPIPNLRAKAIATASSHVLLIDLQDQVWSWGWIHHEQRKTPFPRPVGIKARAVACGFTHSCLLDLEGRVWCYGSNGDGQLGLGDRLPRTLPTPIPDLKAKAIFCGGYHTMVIDDQNRVWGFGCNSDGQLGFIDREDRLRPVLTLDYQVKSLACGKDYTLVVDLEDNVHRYGLGSPIQGFKARSIATGVSHSFLVGTKMK